MGTEGGVEELETGQTGGLDGVEGGQQIGGIAFTQSIGGEGGGDDGRVLAGQDAVSLSSVAQSLVGAAGPLGLAPGSAAKTTRF